MDLALDTIQGLTLTTTDGQEIRLEPGRSLLSLLPNSGGGSNESLYRITAGQPRDNRWREASGQLYLTRKVKETVKDSDGNLTEESRYVADNQGPFGTTMRVWPLGFVLNRGFFPKFDPNATDVKPNCHSENYLQPDAQYAGKYSTQCCALNAKGKLEAVCPMAKWGAQDPITKKNAPPVCQEQYVIFVAVTLEKDGQEPELVVAECYFKSGSAQAGKSIMQQLEALQLRGLPIYNYPIDLLIKEAGQGNTYTGTLRTDVKQEFTPEDVAGFDAALSRVAEAIRVRNSRAEYVPNADRNGGNSGNGSDQQYAPDTMPMQITKTVEVAEQASPFNPPALNGEGRRVGTEKKKAASLI